MLSISYSQFTHASVDVKYFQNFRNGKFYLTLTIRPCENSDNLCCFSTCSQTNVGNKKVSRKMGTKRFLYLESGRVEITKTYNEEREFEKSDTHRSC